MDSVTTESIGVAHQTNADLLESRQSSGAVPEFSTPLVNPVAKSPRSETLDAAQNYNLVQNRQPGKIESAPLASTHVTDVEHSEVRRKRSSSEPGHSTSERRARALGVTLLPQTTCRKCLKSLTPIAGDVDDPTTSFSPRPINTVDPPAATLEDLDDVGNEADLCFDDL